MATRIEMISVMSEIQSKMNKICPFCFVPLATEAKTCFSCRKKVGKINKHGMAKKPINYWSYAVCFLIWIIFAFYVLWAFF